MPFTIEGVQPLVTDISFSKCVLYIEFNINVEAGGDLKCFYGDVLRERYALTMCCTDIFDDESVAKLGTGMKTRVF